MSIAQGVAAAGSTAGLSGPAGTAECGGFGAEAGRLARDRNPTGALDSDGFGADFLTAVIERRSHLTSAGRSKSTAIAQVAGVGRTATGRSRVLQGTPKGAGGVVSGAAAVGHDD